MVTRRSFPVMPSHNSSSAPISSMTAGRCVRQQWNEVGTGDNQGQAVVLAGSVDGNTIGLFRKEFMLDRASIRYETRLLALIGLNPVVLGMESDLERSTYSNQEE